MAWIESHQTLEKHGKLLKLTSSLGVEKYQVIGHLHTLWWWAIDNATDGSLAGYTPDIIANVAGWHDHWAWWEGYQEEDPTKSCRSDSLSFFLALVQAGFIDYPQKYKGKSRELFSPEGGDLGNFSPLPPETLLHDWLDYCGDLVKKRLDNKLSKRLKSDSIRANLDRGENLPPRRGDKGRKSPSTVPYRTVPNNSHVEESAREEKSSSPKRTGIGLLSLETLEKYEQLLGHDRVVECVADAMVHKSWNNWVGEEGKARGLANWLKREAERSPQFRSPPSANGTAPPGPKLLTLAEFSAQHQAEGWDELYTGHQYDRYRQAARAGG